MSFFSSPRTYRLRVSSAREKRVLPRTMADHINIRLKFVRDIMVNLVGLESKVVWNQIWSLRASGSIDNTECVSIDYRLQLSTAGLLDGQLRVFIILSLKCTKITIFLQITPKPENILKRLQNNYDVFKNTYISSKSG